MSEFRYAQYCPAARAAEVVGNRWSLLVLRELMVGPQRFSDLRRRLPGVSTSVLAERLAALEAFGVVARDELPPPAASLVYRLTPHGEAFRPILHDLMRWGLRWLGQPTAAEHFEPSWLRLVVEAFAAPPPTPPRRYALSVVGRADAAPIRFAGGAQGLRFLAAGEAIDTSVAGTPSQLLGLASGLLTVDAARAAGARIEGDLAALAELPRQFRFDSTSRAQSVLPTIPGDTP